MRRAVLAISSTVAVLVLLLSFKTHATPGLAVAAPPAIASASSPTPSAAASPAPSTAASPTPSAAAAPSTASSTGTSTGTGTGTKTVTGTAADTRYGPVQVQVTVTDGTVTAVAAVDYPTQERRDYEINAYAIPQLDKEATAAKSAQIDMVSGATYTSQGYLTSLQSALDQAGLS